MLNLLIAREAMINIIVALSVIGIVIGALFAIALILLIIAFLIENVAFGKRCDKNPNIKYFTAEDFGLSAESVCLKNGLRGFIYAKNDVPQKQAFIIFCHGMGPGHIAYTTEIAYFCKLGYRVLAIDSRGCNFSEGKNLKGMYCGVETVLSAIDFVNTGSENKIYLIGHSWGAYSALCASAERKVGAVVAISGPDTPSKTMQDGATPIISEPFAAILRPFWWLVNLFKYGTKGNISAAKRAMKSGTPTLLIHGDRDNIVKLKNSVYSKAGGKNIIKILAKGKAHNPYNTQNAEILLAELSAKLRNGEKDFSAFDFNGVTEEDAEVMGQIAEFLESN